jgi:AdoMet-dependent heme synthase
VNGEPTPEVALESLDELWFQVAGTLCNLACTHCFISCSPRNAEFGFLGLEAVRERLAEARAAGVKEYYFTGGEPFLNPEMPAILEETLRQGPATVLTNGTVLRDALVDDLRSIAEGSRYSFEVRISIDGHSRAMNDAIRGQGAFDGAVRGLRLLARAGFLPILTAVQTWNDAETPSVLRALEDLLRSAGCSRPRIKLMPTLRIGMEALRTRGYLPEERVTREMMEGYDPGQLLCSRARMVTDRGVAVCPILIETPGAHLGRTLEEADRPFAIGHDACWTCWAHGAICSNAGSLGREDR